MSNDFQKLSDAIAGAVETLAPSIVRVEARRRLPATGIVWSADGLIVTAHHVVQRDENIRVGLADGRVVEASLVGRDPYTDLALIRADASDLSVPEWASDNALKVGNLVIAAGRARQDIRISMGAVSAIRKMTAGNLQENYVQAEITMYPGFSGGPLLDASAVVHGLNTSGLMRNANLTLPVSTIRRVVQHLEQHGRVQHGYLGISAQPVRLPGELGEKYSQETALLLMQVESDSPAAAGGLLMGDTLVLLDGHPLRQMDDLHAQLYGRVGDSVKLTIVRGGEVQEVSVVAGERP